MTAGASKTAADPPPLPIKIRFRVGGASGRATPSLRHHQRETRAQPKRIVMPQGGPFSAPIGGPVCTPIDIPGFVSQPVLGCM